MDYSSEYRGYTITRRETDYTFRIAQRGEFIEEAVSVGDAHRKIDGYFKDVK